MPLFVRCVGVGALLLTCLMGIAAAHGLTLSDSLSDDLAGSILARVLTKAGENGQPGAEGLGKPYALTQDGHPLTVIVPGRGPDVGPGDRVMTCFLALVEPGYRIITIVPIPWNAHPTGAGCHGYTALGLMPSGRGIIRLGILYDMDERPFKLPVVIAWRDGLQPGVDAAGTAACISHHVTTIAEMRRPGCGKPSALERAYPAP